LHPIDLPSIKADTSSIGSVSVIRIRGPTIQFGDSSSRQH
jgi:hypothetical protein